jgi:hypothetical protein
LYLGALEDPQQQMPIDEPQFNLSIISNDVVVHGSLPKSYKLDGNEVAIAHWSVLINCPEVQYWKNYHLHCPAIAGDVDYHNRTFANYFSQWVRVYICVYIYFLYPYIAGVYVVLFFYVHNFLCGFLSFSDEPCSK